MNAIIFQALVLIFGSQEVLVDQVTRYTNAIENVVNTEPLPFHGKNAKEKSAILLAKLAWNESGLREEIEYCRFKHLPGLTEDDGKSVGLGQSFSPAARYGYTRDEICGNAELQFRIALRYLTAQVNRCKDVEQSLSSYNRNRCMISMYSARIMNGYRKIAARFGYKG